MSLTKTNKQTNKHAATDICISTAELEHAFLVSKGLKVIGVFLVDSELPASSDGDLVLHSI
jgi:hypothetical protein